MIGLVKSNAGFMTGMILLVEMAAFSAQGLVEQNSLKSGYQQQQQQQQPETTRITEHPHDVTVFRDEPATLRCSAQGLRGSRAIVWYRDGQVIAAGWRHRRRVLLPAGSLFFLRVVQSDAGTYFCQAGSARSRNATLTVAYIEEKFRAAPKSAAAILGELATLQCRGPRGVPKPDIQWRFNGVLLSQSERCVIDEDGNLEIHTVTSGDAGRYQCIARNVAGIRESPPVHLYVHQRPEIIRPPRNITAAVGSSVTFDCSASGDPLPQITWRRPDGRFRSTDRGHILRLDRITADQSGRYLCKAENTIGSAWAWAVLTVVAPPAWLSTNENDSPLPKVIRILSGQPLVVNCPASGIPPPLVFWSREGIPMSIEEDVFFNGTLMIKSVDRNDSGILRCAAVNDAGSVVAGTKLHVLTKHEMHPPLIEIGPANQTLPQKSSALLECQAEDSDSILWYQDGIPLNLTSTTSRITLEDTSHLRIRDLQLPDSGLYTCSIQQANLTSNWSAILTVTGPGDVPSKFQHNSSNLLLLPGSPSQPRLSMRRSNAISIIWQPSQREGSSPFLGYTVEVYSSAGWKQSFLTWSGWLAARTKAWRIAARNLKAETFTLDGLEADTSYAFVVRAENRNGFSLPSPVSSWFFTSASGSESTIPQKAKIRQRLAALQTELVSAATVNSSAIRLSWRFSNGDGADVEGLYLWYRPLEHWDEQTGPRFQEDSSFRIATVINPEALTHTLLGLVPNTLYVVFLVPFYASVDGTPSNCRTLTTDEDAPNGPPTKVSAEHINATSVLIKWNPPLKTQQNGIITGYQVYITLSDSATLLANLSLPASPTSVIIGGLVPGRIYTIRVAAATGAGLGPSSASLTFWTDSRAGESTPEGEIPSLEQQTWPILLLGGAFLSLLGLFVAALLFRRRWNKNKALRGISSSSAPGQPEQREALWKDDSRTVVLERNSSNCADLVTKRIPREVNRNPGTLARSLEGNASRGSAIAAVVQDSRNPPRQGSPWHSCYSDGVILYSSARAAKIHRKTSSMKL